jgi:hypothetical protein
MSHCKFIAPCAWLAIAAFGAFAPPGARAEDVPWQPTPLEPTPDATTSEEHDPAEDAPAKIHHAKLVVVGLKLGGAINVFNTMGAAFSPELEVGILLPPLDQSFEVFLAARWAAPSDDGESEPDARLPGDGVARWSVTRNELALGLGLRYRLPLGGDLTPYLGAGVRLYLLATEVEGDADGQPFGVNEETGSAVGFLFQLGAEYRLGPGALLFEVAVNGAPLDQTILADTNASSLDLYLGYRFFF